MKNLNNHKLWLDRTLRPPTNKCFRIFFMTICILLASIRVVASGIDFQTYTSLKHAPSTSEPWITIELCYFRGFGGSGGQFLTDPVITINGSELTLQHLTTDRNNIRDTDGWYKDIQYSSDKAYAARMWDPYRNNGNEHRVTVFIVPKTMRVGEKYNITIKGQWNSQGRYTNEQNWTTTTHVESNGGIEGSWSISNLERVNYNKIRAKVNLAKAYGPTTVYFGSESDYKKNTYVSSSKVGKRDFSAGTSGSTSFEMNYQSLNTVAERCYFEIAAARSFTARGGSGFWNTTIYKWVRSAEELQPYIRPTEVTTTVDTWKKTVKLNWKTNGSVTDGKWSIYRYPKGDKNKGEPFVTNLSATAIEYLDYSSNLTYEKEYTYDVAFVPDGADVKSRFNNYVKSANADLTRKFDISITSIESGKNSITVNWQTSLFEGDKDYKFDIYRSIMPINGNTYQWESIANNIRVTDKTLKSFSYTDDWELQTCPSYVYRIVTHAQGDKEFSTQDEKKFSGKITGGTMITSLNASKGDYTGVVKIDWDVSLVGSDVIEYELSRRLINSDDYKVIYKTKGNATQYSYEDNTAMPGNYYVYRVRFIAPCKDSSTGDTQKVYGNEKIDQGFCRSSGIVSGRVSYGTGTAVPNVKVQLMKNTEDGSKQFYALKSNGKDCRVLRTIDHSIMTSNFGKAFSVQLLVNPDSIKVSKTGGTFMEFGSLVSLGLRRADNSSAFVTVYYRKSDGQVGSFATNLKINCNEYTSLTLTRKDKQLNIYAINSEGKLNTWKNDSISTDLMEGFVSGEPIGISFGGEFKDKRNNIYNGYVDEMRVFAKRALSEEEIRSNYNRTLNGTEKGLFIYWPIDEGITNQTIAFDYSRSSGVANNNHGEIKGCDISSSNVPPSSLLSLYATTDSLGNYTVRGIPFSGDGITYNVIPQLGVHTFTPIQQNVFVSASSLVHNGINFTDNSSFAVSGKVRYCGSTIPVEGCNLYVDGTVCTKDGKLIETDSEGKFTISVPIGDHSITIAKNGHTFTKSGRFPDNPNEKYTFDREFEGEIAFWDSTLVNFTGRVVGGAPAMEYPLGLRANQKNNLGKAIITLKYGTGGKDYYLNAVEKINDGVVTYDPSDEERSLSSKTPNIVSSAKIGSTDANCNTVTITTDPSNGEFSAMLPPLTYNIEKVEFAEIDGADNPNNKTFEEELKGFRTQIDITNPLQEYSDSVLNEAGTYSYYKYNYALKRKLRSKPTFSVLQEGATPGAYGIKDTYFFHGTDTIRVKDIYYQSGDTIGYKFSKPVFKMLDTYTFNIKAAEQYINYDGGKDAIIPDEVPMSGMAVTISNALSSAQSVYNEGDTAGTVKNLKVNEIELDSVGCYTYKWKAGLPNITEPYSRDISFYYTIDNAQKTWPAPDEKPLSGIILGTLSEGNDFVTNGPKMVEMILRDPPGSQSSTTWTTGTTNTHFKSKGSVWSGEETASYTESFGLSTTIGTGVGVMKLEKIEVTADETKGISAVTTGESANSWSHSVTRTRSISTSSEVDYIGHKGDVFVGTSTNIVYGKAKEVKLVYVSKDSVRIEVQPCRTAGLTFSTDFAYTTYEIENHTLPELENIRNGLLEYRADTVNVRNNTDHPIYVTMLRPGDPGFGTNNNDKIWGKDAINKSYGRSYKMVMPDNWDQQRTVNDTIVELNMYIENWRSILRLNEEQKVEARKTGKSLLRNHSFDAGASLTMSNTVEKTSMSSYDITVMGIVHYGLTAGMGINDFGFSASLETSNGGGTHDYTEDSETTLASFEYTLLDTDAGDTHTVDVYDGGTFGPIFYTRAGKTSNPYECKVTSTYLDKEETLMEATLQIEKPELMVDNKKMSIVSDVPSGSAANFTLQLNNLSESGDDVYYKLLVVDNDNFKDASVTLNGTALTNEGRVIKVPFSGTIEKVIQLKQTDLSKLKYEDIAIVLAATSQYNDTGTLEAIGDTVRISANFVPSSSPVEMQVAKTVVNSSMEENPQVDITFRNFNRKYVGQKAFRVQAYAPGSSDWTTIHEYVLDDKDLQPGNKSVTKLPKDGDHVSYTYDMRALADGNYRLRVLSVSSYGGEEITRSSEEIAIVKDMQRPMPLGFPQPSDGMLGIGKDISVLFNEDIVKGSLTDEANFEVTAMLNGSTVTHNTALDMQQTSMAAHTEAQINLGDKDFAMDMWINVDGEGTILSHGSAADRLKVGVDSDSRLVVALGNDSYTSAEKIPQGKWAYLTLSYACQGNNGVLNAAVAYDSDETRLFTNAMVKKYKGNGKLVVGENMRGAIHELTLWDEAHSISEAQAERQKTKLASTPHLIGYWRMDEGTGNVITDYARRRHMYMPASTWYVNNVNYAVKLDGTSHLDIQTATVVPSSTDNYAVELWLKADKQSAEAQVMQLGDVAVYADKDGKLCLTSNDNEWTAQTGDILDNAWHHIALNVLRRGNATLYVDGKQLIATASKNIGSLASDHLVIGARRKGDNSTVAFSYDRLLNGYIDEVRLWKATLNATALSANRMHRLTGRESGLVAYYPFETKTLNTNGVITTAPIDSCVVKGSPTLRAKYGSEELDFTRLIAPALSEKQVEQNVRFHFTASDNMIVINLDESKERLEGCTVNFTVKRVRDLNGNACEPICWSALVSQNPLSWRTETNTSSQYASASLSAEQELGATTALTAHIVNKGSTAQAWTIEGLPSWLKASQTSGNIEAQSEQDITLTVLASCPTGRHSADIYLTTEDGLSSALTMDMRVRGNAPAWEVDASKYESSMNVVGKLIIEDIPTSDIDDIVAAFIDGECRGVAHPTYNSRYDDYFVLLDIYANGSDKGKDVEFRVYDADQDRILPRVKTSAEVSFEANTLIGAYQNPLLLEALPYVEQTLNLTEGWNWTSLNVVADDLNAKNIWAAAANRLDVVKSKRASIMSYDGVWEGNDFEMSLAEMYKVKAAEATSVSVFGTLPTTEQKTITVRSGWNWIGFNAMQPMSVADAFAALDPVDGDMVKSKQGFAIFDGYEWSGTLTTLIPGNGYMYRSMDSQTRSFCYPEVTLMAAPIRLDAQLNAEGEGAETPFFEPIDDALYPGNMTVVARVYYDGEPMANAEVGVFAADECRTHEYTDADGFVYLTIPGDRAEALSFKLRHNGETHISETLLNYQDDGVVGNKREPFVVAFGDLTSINVSTIDDADEGAEWYDVEGRRLPKKPTETGVYIKTKNGKAQKVTIVNREINR